MSDATYATGADNPLPRERSRIFRMFTELRLKNFKSIREGRVPLHPLTVIVGANSSGKSTVLQAILALAQTAKSEVGTDRISLNGEYVRLGEFREVQSFGTDVSRGISIGLSAEVSQNAPGMRTSRDASQRHSSKLVWDSSFTVPSDPSKGYGLLRNVELRLDDDEAGPKFSLEIASIRQSSEEESETRLDNPFGQLRGPLLEVDGRLNEYQRYESHSIHSVRFWAGIPEKIIVELDRFKLYAQEWWDAWLREHQEEYDAIRREMQRSGQARPEKTETWAKRIAAVTTAAKQIKLLEKSPNGDQAETGLSDQSLLEREVIRQEFLIAVRQCKPAQRKRILWSMSFLGERGFQEHLRKELEHLPSLDTPARAQIGGELGSLFESSSRYLRLGLRAIKYLGPLREAPKALYDPSPDRFDIGTRGEYAAAVLDAHSRDSIPCPLPTGGVQNMELGAALNIWLSELGLADKAQAKDLGRLGMSLSIAPRGMDKFVDLTAVGVGISQVIPVVLLCLWSKPRSLILIEQPELHLHPAMQLKLADFLLASIRSGRQIVIETHSEHLINRLRRRVADDTTNTLSQSIGLLFAEQKDGISQYRATNISDSGGLSQGWPEGFLDVGSNEATEFISEALQRRRQATTATDLGKK